MNNYNIANDFSEMQYSLILLELQDFSEEEKHAVTEQLPITNTEVL